MLNLAMIYFALPQIRGFAVYDQNTSLKSFWIMNFFMIMVVFSFTTAGIVQTYVQRVMGIDYLTAQRFVKLWLTVLWVSGWGVAVGVGLYLFDFFSLKALTERR